MISVVIPAHNEAVSLPATLFEVGQTLEDWGEPYEIIVVDDGSTDRTQTVLAALADDWPTLRVVALDANSGQSAAFAAGFHAVRGDIIVTLDADGQNPPAEIPRLLSALAEHDCDMVCGWRQGRQDRWTKRLASKFANTLRRSFLQDGIHDTGCSLKAFRREAIRDVKLLHGMHRFLPALVQIEGFRVREIPVSHRPRTGGTSHYGILNRLCGPLVDMLAVRWMQSRARRWRVLPAEEVLSVAEHRVCQSGTASPLPETLRTPIVSRSPEGASFGIGAVTGGR